MISVNGERAPNETLCQQNPTPNLEHHVQRSKKLREMQLCLQVRDSLFWFIADASLLLQ